MNMRVSMLSVAAVAAMVFAALAQAITVQLDFTANFSASDPQTTEPGLGMAVFGQDPFS